MQNLIFKVFWVALFIGFVFSCKPKLDVPEPDKGSLDVSKFVAIGNSITAGYADNALYYDGQMVSYVNLLAEQFKQIGGNEFRIPLMPAGVGVGASGNAKLMLALKPDCKNVVSLSPIAAASSGDLAGLFTGINAEGPFNNMGVPGAKAITAVFPGYGNPALGLGNYNPFFTRMLRASEYATASMLGIAAEQKPTFYSLFIGNNDVLGYASSGGSSDIITPLSGAPSIGFNESIDAIVAGMSTNGAKAVIANVPDITNLPFFTTIPYNGLVLTRQSEVDSLNFTYAVAQLTFSIGVNAFVMAVAPPPFARQMKPNELVLLSTPKDSLKCGGWGSRKPLNNQFVLSLSEISKIQDAIYSFNIKLKDVADKNAYAFVDVNNFMAKTKKGIIYNGVTINTTFVSGGAFSLDAIHLTPLGNALLANEFIKSINSTYRSSIPMIEASKYKGVVFP